MNNRQDVENVIIIGSGPAGHTAAIYTARAELNPLMFEGFMAWGVAAGGQLTTTTEVENFPGFPEPIQGPELMMRMRQQSQRYGTRIETKTINKVDFSSFPYKVRAEGESEPRQAKAVIIATWATAKRLWIPGEKEFWQRWISACAVCDWGLPMFRNQPLVVVGWGDTAAEEASYLSKFGSKVYMLVRRDQMRASKAMQKRVMNNPKIEILRNTEAKEAIWDETWLKGVKIVNNKTGEEKVLEARGLFYAIGHKPNTDFLEWQVLLDESWYIITKPWTPFVYRWPALWNTEAKDDAILKWVFAAGDVQDKKYRQAITAAWSGAMAGIDAEHYLAGLED